MVTFGPLPFNLVNVFSFVSGVTLRWTNKWCPWTFNCFIDRRKTMLPWLCNKMKPVVIVSIVILPSYGMTFWVPRRHERWGGEAAVAPIFKILDMYILNVLQRRPSTPNCSLIQFFKTIYVIPSNILSLGRWTMENIAATSQLFFFLLWADVA